MLLHEIRNDQKFFDDLTEVMKAFKKTVDFFNKISTESMMEVIHSQIYDEKLLTELHEQTKGLICFFENLSIRYKNDEHFNQNRQSHSATFNRFCCRIVETLSYSKMKMINNMGESPIKIFLQDAFLVMNNFRSDFNFSFLLKKISILIKKASKQLPTRFNQVIEGKLLDGQCQRPQHESIKSRLKIHKSPQKGKTSSESKISKIMQALKKSYSSLSVMEIQYVNYRNTFFQAKSQANSPELLQQCLYRNRFIMGQITLYSKKFSQYMRKGDSPTRKNKLMGYQERTNIKFKTSKDIQQVEKSQQHKKQIFNMTRNVNKNTRYGKQKPIIYNQTKTQQHAGLHDNVSNQSLEKFSPISEFIQWEKTPKIKASDKLVINLNDLDQQFIRTNHNTVHNPQFLVGKTVAGNLQISINQQCRKKKVTLNQVLINGNKLRLAPIRGINQQQIEQKIRQKRQKIALLIKSQKQKLIHKGSYMSVGHVSAANNLKITNHINMFKLKHKSSVFQKA